jgi:hypothetical protein
MVSPSPEPAEIGSYDALIESLKVTSKALLCQCWIKPFFMHVDAKFVAVRLTEEILLGGLVEY